MGCLPMSWIMAVVGTIQDRPRWLAIVMLVVTSLLGAALFGMPILLRLCS